MHQVQRLIRHSNTCTFSFKSDSTTVTESPMTERSISEIGSGSQISVSGATQYDSSVAQAVSAYAKPANVADSSVAGPINKEQQKTFAYGVKQLQSVSKVPSGGGKASDRKLFIMWHGERMDRLFPEWLTAAFSDDGRYNPYAMNQPLTMIERIGSVGWAGYEYDSPVTKLGSLSSQMIGRGIKICKVDVKQVISSPVLSYVQTAHAVMKALDNVDLKIRA